MHSKDKEGREERGKKENLELDVVAYRQSGGYLVRIVEVNN